MTTLLRDAKYEHQGSGFFISAGTDVTVLRVEGDRSVIRGQGLRFCCNPAKQPTEEAVTLSVPTIALDSTERN